MDVEGILHGIFKVLSQHLPGGGFQLSSNLK